METIKELAVINGFPNYLVSSTGEVINRSKRIHKTMTPHLKSGYARVGISRQGQTRKFMAHRLVAIAFVPNPEGKPEVNHINGNKLDNRVCNLEWVTSSENVMHSIRTGLTKPVSIENREKTKMRNIERSKHYYYSNDGKRFDSACVLAHYMGVKSQHVNYLGMTGRIKRELKARLVN